MAERSKRTGVNQDRVVQELAKVAFIKMTDVVDQNGKIKDTASEDDLSCIESIKYKHSDTDSGYSVEREVKIASKLKALELLGKHLGMWNDKLDVNVTLPIVISGEDSLDD
jgi:phage terminase small subunit